MDETEHEFREPEGVTPPPIVPHEEPKLDTHLEELRQIREEIRKHNNWHAVNAEEIPEESAEEVPEEPAQRPLEVVELDVTPVQEKVKDEYRRSKHRF